MKAAFISIIILFTGLSTTVSFAQKFVSTDEQDEMIFLLEEEKLARDVYFSLDKKNDLQVFKNI